MSLNAIFGEENEGHAKGASGIIFQSPERNAQPPLLPFKVDQIEQGSLYSLLRLVIRPGTLGRTRKLPAGEQRKTEKQNENAEPSDPSFHPGKSRAPQPHATAKVMHLANIP